jgi:hypothetical protein
VNEKEVKDAARTGVCSVTGRSCKCAVSDGCRVLGKPALDKVPKESVRALRATRILLEAGLDALDECTEDYLRVRAFPGPEVREVRRKVVTAISMIEEIGGEL